MEIIDSHVHSLMGDPVPDRELPCERLLELMEQAGVAGALLVQSVSGAGTDNSYVLDAAGRYPERFRAVCAIDAARSDAPAKVERLAMQGACGIRLLPNALVGTDPAIAEALAAIAGLGLPATFMGKPDPARIDRVAREHPELRFAVDHMANADLHENSRILADLAHHPNLYMKFSTKLVNLCEGDRAQAASILRDIASQYGTERMMWGSNYPADREPEWTYPAMAEAMLDCVSDFSGAEQARMMGNVARTFWSLG